MYIQYINLSSITKECINCKGNYRILALKCQLRKDIMKAKMMLQEENKNKKYWDATKTPAPGQHVLVYYPQAINKEIILRITTCNIHAHFRNIKIHEATAKSLTRYSISTTFRKQLYPIFQTPASFSLVVMERDRWLAHREGAVGGESLPEVEEKQLICKGVSIGLRIYVSEERNIPTSNIVLAEIT